jgi:hypothetical protein
MFSRPSIDNPLVEEATSRLAERLLPYIPDEKRAAEIGAIRQIIKDTLGAQAEQHEGLLRRLYPLRSSEGASR